MTIYCVYITFYKGNKLPPFYIGYSTVKNIMNGYHGSVSSKKYKQIWLSELKDNPQLFKTIILSTHSSKEDAKGREEYIQRYFNVHRNPMFINLNISGKNFCPSKEHYKLLSQRMTGKSPSIETREKLRKTSTGFRHSIETKHRMSNIKKGKKFTEEHKLKIGDTRSGKPRSPETKEKLRLANLGKKHSLEVRQKMSETRKGRKMSPESIKKTLDTKRKLGIIRPI